MWNGLKNCRQFERGERDIYTQCHIHLISLTEYVDKGEKGSFKWVKIPQPQIQQSGEISKRHIPQPCPGQQGRKGSRAADPGHILPLSIICIGLLPFPSLYVVEVFCRLAIYIFFLAWLSAWTPIMFQSRWHVTPYVSLCKYHCFYIVCFCSFVLSLIVCLFVCLLSVGFDDLHNSTE